MSDLSTVTVGQLLAISKEYSAGVTVHPVSRITPQYVEVAGLKIRKTDGLVRGTANTWNRRYAHPATEYEILQARIDRVTQALRTIKVTSANVEAVEALIAASVGGSHA